MMEISAYSSLAKRICDIKTTKGKQSLYPMEYGGKHIWGVAWAYVVAAADPAGFPTAINGSIIETCLLKHTL
jgi:hypothetical protein